MNRTKLLQGLSFRQSGRPFCGLEVAIADLFWLSDEQWAVIEPFMPRDQPGPERKDDRQIISGPLRVSRRPFGLGQAAKVCTSA